MKRYFVAGAVVFLTLMIIGCASMNRYPIINMTLSKETWQRSVYSNPNVWSRGASLWFLTGNPHATTTMYGCAPYSAAMSTMRVRVPNFSKIRVNGDFKVQIFGADTNSVYVYGPNLGVRQLNVEVQCDTLCINQPNLNGASTRNVIVRIGVKHLSEISQMRGSGSIEAIYIESNGLIINSGPMARGNMYLSGNMNLRCLTHLGAGCINVFGANTPNLNIDAAGIGSVNISGNVGVRRIKKRGFVEINIVGANTPCLKISATGKGKVGIKGHVNVQEIKASDNVCVFICGVDSCYIYAFVCQHARIGLAGYTKDLYVLASDCGSVWGRYLCTRSAYVKARDFAHINLTATDRIFASATQNASVYFFGSPNVLSQFVTGNGIVMPIYGGFGMQNCLAPTCPVRVNFRAPCDYKGERIAPPPCRRPPPVLYQGAG